MLTEYKPNRPLRSVGSSQLEIARVHTKQVESAFSYYAARSWKQLPEEIRCAKTLATFIIGFYYLFLMLCLLFLYDYFTSFYVKHFELPLSHSTKRVPFGSATFDEMHKAQKCPKMCLQSLKLFIQVLLLTWYIIKNTIWKNNILFFIILH